jgi:Tfp pilus assembly protein PilV
MFNSICNKKGITLIEVMVSLLLITVGVLSLITLLPAGIRLSGTSDLLGRAAGILQAELEQNEIMIMNGKNLDIPLNPPEKWVYGSGKTTAQPGDIRYTVATVVEPVGGSFRVRVTVTWQGNTTGIAESLIVGRQVSFAQ